VLRLFNLKIFKKIKKNHKKFLIFNLKLELAYGFTFFLNHLSMSGSISANKHAQKCGSSCAKEKVLPFSWLPSSLSFLIILLPKCPFCIVAYTSSMAICGASPLVSHHTDWGAWFALFLGMVITFSIYRNYRGLGTTLALLVALLGLLFVGIGVFVADAFVYYYVGSIVLLLAAFFNGSGFRFISKFFTYVKSI
jgi:hypothetical protein